MSISTNIHCDGVVTAAARSHNGASWVTLTFGKDPAHPVAEIAVFFDCPQQARDLAEAINGARAGALARGAT